MKNKIINIFLVLILLCGIGVLSYPFISNILQDRKQDQILTEYNEEMEKLSDAEIEDAKEKEEEVVVITISSKLSGTYNGAMLAKDMAEYDNIYVVDSLLASLSERLLVEYAVKLRDAGMGAKELVRKLEQDRERVILTGVPSTLLYLKMGGRISPVVAAVGGVIGIKPVLWLKDGVIESRSKARGMRMAKSGMQSFLKDYEADPAMPVMFAHSDNAEMGQQFMEETVQQFGLTGCSLHEIGMAIGTHIGPDALMMAFMRK